MEVALESGFGTLSSSLMVGKGGWGINEGGNGGRVERGGSEEWIALPFLASLLPPLPKKHFHTGPR